MKRMCKCPNCGTMSPKVEDKVAESVKAEAFDCPNCGEKFSTPLNSPLIVEVEE